MKICTIPVITRINILTEQEKKRNSGICPIAFAHLMDTLTKMSEEAQNSAYTYTPMPRFSYNKTILSELVNVLSDEQKMLLEDVGVEFRKQAGSFTRVHMCFIGMS